jgi:hypothetical protein
VESSSDVGGSPLETFLKQYLDLTGGVWDEIEPQVYDVALPDGADVPTGRDSASGILRLAFDPEALPEHATAQLASFGTPLVDQLLTDALHRGRAGQFFFIGLNLLPHDLLGRLRRSVTVAPATMQVETIRALHVPQIVFWFQAAFVSDQKEQLVLPVAIDLHYGREVRHLDQLLDPTRLAEQPSPSLPPARSRSLRAGYHAARTQILRSVAALANTRGRELRERCEIQIERLERYYADLRIELDEQKKRASNADEAAARHTERRAALAREEQLRIAELRQKSQLQVDLRLLQLLRVEQPKLLVRVKLTATDCASGALELVWDPLLEAVEAPPCPQCGKPSYEFALAKSGQVACGSCKPTVTSGKSTKR